MHYSRTLVFDQRSPVHPVSESRGGSLSVTDKGGLMYFAGSWTSCIVTSTDGPLCLSVTQLSLLANGNTWVEANTPGSASPHSLYRQLQNPHVPVS